MKSPSHWAAFSQCAMALLGCEFEWAGLASADHLTSNGNHGNVKGENMGNESRAVTVTAYPALSSVCCFVCATEHLAAQFVVCLHDFVCVCHPTSPGIVIVGHSVRGLNGGEVWLQGEQLTGKVWHTAGRTMERRAQFGFSF